MRLAILQDIQVSSSWTVDSDGDVFEIGGKQRKRTGRVAERARMRRRIKETGRTSFRYDKAEAPASGSHLAAASPKTDLTCSGADSARPAELQSEESVA